jgi:hypothetical protein
MTVARTVATTMAATVAAFAWLGVGAAMVPAAITVAALRARSVFLIKSSIITFFVWPYGGAML